VSNFHSKYIVAVRGRRMASARTPSTTSAPWRCSALELATSVAGWSFININDPVTYGTENNSSCSESIINEWVSKIVNWKKTATIHFFPIYKSQTSCKQEVSDTQNLWTLVVLWFDFFYLFYFLVIMISCCDLIWSTKLCFFFLLVLLHTFFNLLFFARALINVSIFRCVYSVKCLA
jgi:hypothetical protein